MTLYAILLYQLLLNSLINAIQNKSGLKCNEYGRAVYRENSSPILFRSARKKIVSQCGIVSVPLIIGGTKTTEKEFPHMALIGFGESQYSEEIFWSCGGSLISDLYILTAAHCLKSRDGQAQKVRLGMTNINELDSDVQEKNIEKRIPHPNYKRRLKYNDIALLRLDSSVDFTAFVRPACLNTLHNLEGTKAIAIGFGRTSFDGLVFGSKQLMKVTLSVYSNDFCNKIFPSDEPSLPDNIVDTMLCVGEMSGGKDTCQGDSGGPLQIVLDTPYCMYSIIGVTSFGKFCGFANSPAIYTNVASYVPWIESIVWEEYL